MTPGAGKRTPMTKICNLSTDMRKSRAQNLQWTQDAMSSTQLSWYRPNWPKFGQLDNYNVKNAPKRTPAAARRLFIAGRKLFYFRTNFFSFFASCHPIAILATNWFLLPKMAIITEASLEIWGIWGRGPWNH
jgi:hypothetical protein